MEKYLAALIISLYLFSCAGTASSDHKELEYTVVDEQTFERVKKTKKVLYSLPTPVETASIFEDAQVTYNPTILNSIENVSNYSTNAQRAINFGVYGADLSYTNILEQTNGSMAYMNCVQKLAVKMGLISIFESETMEKIEKNINNKDSLAYIINCAYMQADIHLRENEQENLSALIVAGGWIECLYLGAQAIRDNKVNKEMDKIIANQKYSLTHLIDLLDTHKEPEVISISKMMKGLKVSYDKIIDKNVKKAVKTDELATMNIGKGGDFVFDHAVIFEIAEKVQKIRNEMIL